MSESKFGRRDFIKTAVVGGAAAASTAGGIASQDAQAQEQGTDGRDAQDDLCRVAGIDDRAGLQPPAQLPGATK